MRVSPAWRPGPTVGAGPLPGVRLAGALMVLVSLGLGFWPLWYLRRSFSIEPAARELVTSGPYALARHPIYAIYAVGYAGLLLLRPTAVLVFLLVLWCALTYLRVGYEERILMQAFPAYRDYCQRVGAFGPRIWRRRVVLP